MPAFALCFYQLILLNNLLAKLMGPYEQLHFQSILFMLIASVACLQDEFNSTFDKVTINFVNEHQVVAVFKFVVCPPHNKSCGPNIMVMLT